MLPPERRLPGVRELLERHHYFVVHAPRQSGKTTAVRTLADRLTTEGRHAMLYASCETGQIAGDDVERGVQAVIGSLELQSETLPLDLRPEPSSRFSTIEPENRLTAYLQAWSRRCPRPVVLFLDEIDALRNSTLLAVLRQLRTGYPERPLRFPQSIALVGLRDVRDYRIRLREDEASLGTASPFNIKVESITLRNFKAEEVTALLEQHTEDTGQRFTSEATARIWDLSRGQPWLVNALAAQTVDEEVPDRSQPVEVQHVDRAKEVLVERRDSHLDSLTDRLREPRVRRILEPILAGEPLDPSLPDDDVQYVKDLGLAVSGPAGLEIANPIYREVIPRALTSVFQEALTFVRTPFMATDGTLDTAKLLNEFRAFWREHAEFYLARQPYSEAAAQLIFMAFLQRVVNGGGFIDREYGVGRKRIDLCVRWPHPRGLQRWAVELKVWRDGRPDPLKEGLDQLTAYLKRLNLDFGTLLIFDNRTDAPSWGERGQEDPLEIEQAGRRLQVLRL